MTSSVRRGRIAIGSALVILSPGNCRLADAQHAAISFLHRKTRNAVCSGGGLYKGIVRRELRIKIIERGGEWTLVGLGCSPDLVHSCSGKTLPAASLVSC